MTLQTPWRPLKLGSGSSFGATFSNDGRLLAVIGRRVSLWDVFARRRLWLSRPFPHPSNASFSPDDAIIAVKHTNGRIITLDARDGSVVRDFANQSEGQGADVSFSRCGKYLIDAAETDAVIVRRARDGKITHRRPIAPEVMVHTVHPIDGGRQWLVHCWTKAHDSKKPPRPSYFEIWDWPFGAAPKSRWSTKISPPSTATPSWDGRLVSLVAWTTNRLFVFEIASGKLLSEQRCHRGAMAAAWSRDGQTLLAKEEDGVSLYESTRVRATGKAKPVRSIGLHMAADIATTPRHDLVALCSWDVGFVVDPATAPDILLLVPPHMQRAKELLES